MVILEDLSGRDGSHHLHAFSSSSLIIRLAKMEMELKYLQMDWTTNLRTSLASPASVLKYFAKFLHT